MGLKVKGQRQAGAPGEVRGCREVRNPKGGCREVRGHQEVPEGSEVIPTNEPRVRDHGRGWRSWKRPKVAGGGQRSPAEVEGRNRGQRSLAQVKGGSRGQRSLAEVKGHSGGQAEFRGRQQSSGTVQRSPAEVRGRRQRSKATAALNIAWRNVYEVNSWH